MIVVLFVFFAVTKNRFPGFNFIKTFCKIKPLKEEYWGLVAVISIIGSAVLYFLQKVREKVMFRKP